MPGTYYSYLSAINDTFGQGFFIVVPAHGSTIRNYGASQTDAVYASYTITQVPQTPIPATLPLLVSALGTLGIAASRRKRAMAA